MSSASAGSQSSLADSRKARPPSPPSSVAPGDEPRQPAPAPAQPSEAAQTKRGTRFWLVYVALCISLLLAALDLVRPHQIASAPPVLSCVLMIPFAQGAVGTAAPTIVSDLHGQDFSWVASAYSLSSAACLPFSGKLAQIFGRRPTMLGALLIFAAGSAVSGSATSMSILIVGRGKPDSGPFFHHRVHGG